MNHLPILTRRPPHIPLKQPSKIIQIRHPGRRRDTLDLQIRRIQQKHSILNPLLIHKVRQRTSSLFLKQR